MELSKKLKGLETIFPGLAASMHLVSCEEDVQDLEEYVSEAPGPEAFREEVEKEHVLLAIHVLVEGRRGVLLADPGYHVARAVTVMADRAYPHTGKFIQSEEPHCRKEFEYRLNGANHNYVEWRECETRGQSVKEHVALVYVARPYLAAVSVTQRRNLVYNFRSLLTRNQKGQLTAGIYFPVAAKDQQFTIFYETSSEKKRVKMRFATFLDGAKVPEQALQQIETCNSQLLLGDGKLLKMIQELAVVMSESEFIGDLLNIDKSIREVRYT